MTAPAIPVEHIKTWEKMKAVWPDLASKTLKGISGATGKYVVQDIVDLFKSFDQGLASKLKTANGLNDKASKATDRASKQKAQVPLVRVLVEIKGILEDYQKKTKTWAKQDPHDYGTHLRDQTANMVVANLKKLRADVDPQIASLMGTHK